MMESVYMPVCEGPETGSTTKGKALRSGKSSREGGPGFQWNEKIAADGCGSG